MPQQIINTGTAELAGDGESIRTAFQKANSNFTELYSRTTILVDTIPTSSTSTGVTGQIAVDSTSMYICVSTNNWIKIIGSAF
jgi:hypothetical protein